MAGSFPVSDSNSKDIEPTPPSSFELMETSGGGPTVTTPIPVPPKTPAPAAVPPVEEPEPVEEATTPEPEPEPEVVAPEPEPVVEPPAPEPEPVVEPPAPEPVAEPEPEAPAEENPRKLRDLQVNMAPDKFEQFVQQFPEMEKPHEVLQAQIPAYNKWFKENIPGQTLIKLGEDRWWKGQDEYKLAVDQSFRDVPSDKKLKRKIKRPISDNESDINDVLTSGFGSWRYKDK